MAVGEELSLLSDYVAGAGVRDVVEGAELLAFSDDVAVQGAVVGALAEEDLEQAMELAAIAGQLWTVSDVVDVLDMPVLSAFLEARGEALQQMAVDTIFRYGATRALSDVIAETGLDIGVLGEVEIAEGADRLMAAEEMAIVGEEMEQEGAELAAEGLVELAAARGMRDAAETLAADGIAEVAEGSAEFATAETIADIADAMLDESEDNEETA
jgi:hypothetical protein